MEFQRRRGRRRRGEPIATLTIPNHPCTIQPTISPRQWCFTNGITSFLILSSLIGIIYLMMDYQCHSCSTKPGTNHLATNVEKISQNLYLMQSKYHDLEMKVSQLSQELPKLGGQITILEALTNTAVHKEMGWDPKLPFTMSNLDELLKHTVFNEGKNNSKYVMKCSKCFNKPINATLSKPVTVIEG